MFSRITVAVDGSSQANAAFDKSISIAKHFNSKLDLVHVINDAKYGADSAEAFASIDKLKTKAGIMLDKYKQQAMANNVDCIVHLEIGDPAQAIIETAESNNSELIVVGSRGLGLFKDLLVGSVSHKVSQHAKCPVMMVR